MNYTPLPSQDLAAQLKGIYYLAQIPVQDARLAKEKVAALAEVHRVLDSVKKETLAYFR